MHMPDNRCRFSGSFPGYRKRYDGNATFQVAHFSYWALGPYTEPAGSGEFPIMIVAIAVVTVIAVAGAAAYFFLAKKKA